MRDPYRIRHRCDHSKSPWRWWLEAAYRDTVLYRGPVRESAHWHPDDTAAARAAIAKHKRAQPGGKVKARKRKRYQK